MIKRKTKQLLDEKFNALIINLENNYKDLAKDALKDLINTIEELKSSGDINEKDYAKIRRNADDYERKMEGYHH